MKAFIAISVLSLLGISLALPAYEGEKDVLNALEGLFAQEIHGPKTALGRIVRRSTMDDEPFTESEIIGSCNSNGYNTDTLQEAFDDMKTCLRRKQLIITPKNEFLSNIDQCTAETVRIAKICLPENKKYFPDMELGLAKSVVSFLYDDVELFVYGRNIGPCIRNINENSDFLKSEMADCLARAGQKDTDEIPPSKEAYCQLLRPTGQCLIEFIRHNCPDTSDLQQFRNHFARAMVGTCN